MTRKTESKDTSAAKTNKSSKEKYVTLDGDGIRTIFKPSTELVFILDKSGSMHGLEEYTIGGFNSVLKKQKKEDGGNCFVSTILFDDEISILHDRVPIEEVKEMTSKEYFTGGCTALLDAVGRTVNHIKTIHRYLKNEQPIETLFVITTDGMENASREYTVNEIKKLISRQTEKGWEFLFLGANIDAVETAENIGIRKERAANFVNDPRGIRGNYAAIAGCVSILRRGKAIKDGWKDEIDEDYKKRGGNQK